MKVKMILPALMGAKSPFWRPIKYSLEPLWNFMIKTRGLNKMLPLLKSILSRVTTGGNEKAPPFPAIA
jgi:hypothetical protein